MDVKGGRSGEGVRRGRLLSGGGGGASAGASAGANVGREKERRE